MDGTDLIERLIGGRTPDYGKQHGHLRCDTCLSEIHAPADIGMYAGNHDVVRGHVPLQFRVTFCEACCPDEMPIHTKDAVEILLHVAVVDEGGMPRLEDGRVKDKSKSESGVAWNPGEVWESVSGQSAEEMAQSMASKGSALTPAHIWGFLQAMDIDINSLLDENGTYSVSDARESELQEQVASYLLSLST